MLTTIYVKLYKVVMKVNLKITIRYRMNLIHISKILSFYSKLYTK